LPARPRKRVGPRPKGAKRGARNENEADRIGKRYNDPFVYSLSGCLDMGAALGAVSIAVKP